ncbi:MAG: hypothetical protein IJS02_00875 [Bacteroidales bacterium]|nr:hypothetical protein [Bacteroidales bacterium]
MICLVIRLLYGVKENVFPQTVSFGEKLFRKFSHLSRVIEQRVRCQEQRIGLVVAVTVAVIDQSRALRHCSVHIVCEGIYDKMRTVCHQNRLVRGVLHLHVGVHVYSGLLSVIIQLLAPTFVVGIVHIDIQAEIDDVIVPVIPTVVGPHKVIFVPHSRISSEMDPVLV